MRASGLRWKQTHLPPDQIHPDYCPASVVFLKSRPGLVSSCAGCGDGGAAEPERANFGSGWEMHNGHLT